MGKKARLKNQKDVSVTKKKAGKNYYHYYFLGLIIFIGFLIRLYFISADMEVKVAHFPQKGIGYGNENLLGWDGVRYDWIAVNLINGKGYGYYPDKPDAWRPPGYPFFLAAVYYVFGKDYYAVRFFQVLFSTLIIPLVYLIGIGITDRKCALVSALITALYYDLAVYPLIFYTEILFAFFATLTIWLFYKIQDFEYFNPKRIVFIIISGFSAGYTSLVRPNFFPALVFIFPVMIFLDKNRFFSVKKILFICAGMLIVLLPWSVRNTLLESKPVFISTNGGLNFAIGFSERADGFFRTDTGRFTPQEEKLAQEKGYTAVAVRFITQNPIKAMLLFAKKIGLQLIYPSYKNFILFINRIPIPLISYMPFILIIFSGGFIMSLFSRNDKFYIINAYFIGSILIGALFFYMGDRQRIPLIAPMSLLGGFFIVKITDFFKAQIK